MNILVLYVLKISGNVRENQVKVPYTLPPPKLNASIAMSLNFSMRMSGYSITHTRIKDHMRLITSVLDRPLKSFSKYENVSEYFFALSQFGLERSYAKI